MINITTINGMYVVSINNKIIGEVYSFINKGKIIAGIEEALADGAVDVDIEVSKRGTVSWDLVDEARMEWEYPEV